MLSKEIRDKYLRFFQQLGHEVVPSSPLVPSKYDSTLLFSNAGMNQFKDVFVGKEKRGYSRACSSQKCLRVSGKHNDLENVGFTARHHTFFEMLGNFSFGDYFKKEACAWAWELVTSKKHYGIDRDLLYITVLDDKGLGLTDTRAKESWLMLGIPEDRIKFFGRKDNFWQMGDTGPCGPCSEIHIDRRKQLGEQLAKPLGKTCDKCKFGDDTFRKCQGLKEHELCERYVELWNLVFPQYDMQQDGSLEPLEKPGVDTGAGLERFAAVLQNVSTNYETDLFMPIIEKAQEIVGRSATEKDLATSFRVVADHIRALTFAIADGVTFERGGRGSVIRSILRRALRHGRQKLEYPEPFLHQLVGTVVDTMGATYPELVERREYIEKVIKGEEEAFSATLDLGLLVYGGMLTKTKQHGENLFNAKYAFNLHETYGFPFDMTKVMLLEEGLEVDEDGFNRLMERHRQVSRAIGKFEVTQSALAELNLPPTEFVGYSATRTEVEVLYFDEDKIVLDKTPFYAEAGGQVGDTGEIAGANFEFKVTDTRKSDQVSIHLGNFVGEGRPRVGEPANAQVDSERRENIMRNHTATHLLQWALRKVLGNHVKQSGSYVGPDRLRFDFTHFEALTLEEIQQVELLVNTEVMRDVPVSFCEMGYQKALEAGAMAIFEEKYGDKVRMVEVAEYSKELCGGTHTARTGQIGVFHILSEGSIKAGVRRIEAVTGFEELRRLQKEHIFCDWILTTLSPTLDEAEKRIKDLLKTEKMYYKQMEKESRKEAAKTAQTLTKALSEENGLKYLYQYLKGRNRKELSAMVDRFRAMEEPVAVCLTSEENGRLSMVAGASAAAVKEFSFDSGAFAKEAGKLLGGSGGGRADFAQAGGKNLDALKEVEKAFVKKIKDLSGRK